MTDFFSRIAERALNIAPIIQPMIAPLYASEPQRIEDGLFDDVDELEQQNPLSTILLRPKTQTQDAQAPALRQMPPVTLPTIQRSSLSSASESPAQPAMLPAPADIPHSSEIETRAKPQPYPVLQRIIQQPSALHRKQPATTIITTPATQIEHTTSYPATQNPSQPIYEQIDSYVQQSEIATMEPLTQKNKQSSDLKHEQKSNLPDKDTVLPVISSTPAIAGKKIGDPLAEDISQPVTRSARAAIGERASNSLPAIQEPKHYWTVKEEPAPPTIQVTIGRIEVRATMTSTPNTITPQQQRGAPPVMSLDDYLNQRAKGGH